VAPLARLRQSREDHHVPTLFRSDHDLNLDGHSERGSLEAWGTLSALAAATTSLRLGTLVTPATFRHPSVLAKLVATVDQVSGGRVELGLGAGRHEREHEAYGLPFPPLHARLDITEEQLQVLLGTWADGKLLVRRSSLPAAGSRLPTEARAAAAPPVVHRRWRRTAQHRPGRLLRRRIQHRIHNA
jgi:alkanesulfonate monooxygenase SsuD/methylene tetrahydromethanopterin reductase-like flavin-dependent oxidoreductase (luciferase family)